MTMRHRGEGTKIWYRAFHYRWLEQQICARPDVARMLDLGCGSGENMWRFVGPHRTLLGLDVSQARLGQAMRYGPVVQGDAIALPFADGSLDVVYAAHVLHHVAGPEMLMAEVWRCLRPGGTLFLIDTVEDHPLIRWGRTLHPRWYGDAVHVRLRYGQLVEIVRGAGFTMAETGRHNVLFWIWEVLPEHYASLDAATPMFAALEVIAHRLAWRWAAHCYCVAYRAP